MPSLISPPGSRLLFEEGLVEGHFGPRPGKTTRGGVTSQPKARGKSLVEATFRTKARRKSLAELTRPPEARRNGLAELTARNVGPVSEPCEGLRSDFGGINVEQSHCPPLVERFNASRFLWLRPWQRVQRPSRRRPEPRRRVERGKIGRPELAGGGEIGRSCHGSSSCPPRFRMIGLGMRIAVGAGDPSARIGDRVAADRWIGNR